MDIHALEAFCRAFDEGSFGRASEGLFVSRQALSRTMRTLEREVGAPLFVRGAAGVEPTELARMIEPHARRILEEHEAIQADIRKHAQGLAGALVLAIEPNAMMTLPTGALERYRRARPDMAVSTVSASGSSVLEGLAAGAVDAVVSVPMGEDAFAYLPVRREPLCVVLRGEGAGAPGAPAGEPAPAGGAARWPGRPAVGGGRDVPQGQLQAGRHRRPRPTPRRVRPRPHDSRPTRAVAPSSPYPIPSIISTSWAFERTPTLV